MSFYVAKAINEISKSLKAIDTLWYKFMDKSSNIQVLDTLGVGLDEGFAGWDFSTH